jgi:hypothetical protein
LFSLKLISDFSSEVIYPLHTHHLNPYSYNIKLKTKWGGIVAVCVTHNYEVLGLILSQDIGYPDYGVSWFSFLQANARITPSFGHNFSFPNSFLFITQE